MKVAEENGCLRAGDNENDEDKKQKSIHVVNLTGPNAVENEEKLNKNASEWENTAHDDTRDGLGVDGLIRNLSWNLVSSYGLLYCWLAESKICSNKCEGNRDSKPQSQQSDQSEEGDGSRGCLIPEDQVQDEEMSKYNSWTQHGGQEDVALPFLSSKRFVNSSSDIPSRCAQANEQDQGTGHQSSSVGWRQESETSKDQGDSRHAVQLGS